MGNMYDLNKAHELITISNLKNFELTEYEINIVLYINLAKLKYHNILKKKIFLIKIETIFSKI